MRLDQSSGARGLIEFALESLRPMQLGSGLFCTEVVAGDPRPRGVSLRYSLMTYLGLLKAGEAGYDHGFDLERTRRALQAELDSPQLRPGDYGLHLWADARTGGGRSPELLERLRRSLAEAGGLGGLEGMEVAWIVQGLALQVAGGANGDARAQLREALAHALGRRHPRSGLFAHTGDGSLRRRFPNFATQIYNVLALSTVAQHGLDGTVAAEAARAASARLRELQLPDGGWPWLYDIETGRVVEAYEVYTVHQDAMAPMGLLQLSEATGEPEHAAAAAHGVGWIHGRNELGRSMLDPQHGILYRSIRRRRPWDRLSLYANTAGAAATRLARLPRSLRLTELNMTDRPYHLGWVLEAWCGREQMLDPAG
jgi:hypothetical protein